jgi:curved DNA-binding protein CbpA
MIDPYALLGVTIDSSSADVRRAYRALALIAHPDRGGSTVDMQVVQRAFDYVSAQVAQVNRTRTVESLEASFAAFCAAQTAATPEPALADPNAADRTAFNAAFEAAHRRVASAAAEEAARAGAGRRRRRAHTGEASSSESEGEGEGEGEGFDNVMSGYADVMLKNRHVIDRRADHDADAEAAMASAQATVAALLAEREGSGDPPPELTPFVRTPRELETGLIAAVERGVNDMSVVCCVDKGPDRLVGVDYRTAFLDAAVPPGADEPLDGEGVVSLENVLKQRADFDEFLESNPETSMSPLGPGEQHAPLLLQA